MIVFKLTAASLITNAYLTFAFRSVPSLRTTLIFNDLTTIGAFVIEPSFEFGIAGFICRHPFFTCCSFRGIAVFFTGGKKGYRSDKYKYLNQASVGHGKTI